MFLTTLKRAGLGILLGIAIGNLIAVITGFSTGEESRLISEGLIQKAGSEAMAFLLQTLFSGLYGAVCMAGMSLYEVEHWSMLRSYLVHYSIIILSYIPIALFLCWVQTPKELAVITGIQTIAYFIIWLIIYAVYKAQVKELNQKLVQISKAPC